MASASRATSAGFKKRISLRSILGSRIARQGERGIMSALTAAVRVRPSSWYALMTVWARLGQRRETEDALRAGATALARLPPPAHPEHHFAFDAPKLTFYAAMCLTWLHQTEQAEEHARQAHRQRDPDLSELRTRLVGDRITAAYLARFAYDLRWRYAAGVDDEIPGFAHTVLVELRARLRASADPDRIFRVTTELARQVGLVGARRVLDSAPLFDAVATQDTVTLLRGAIRGLLRACPAELAGLVRAALQRDDDY
jgi:hypothetical protein